MRLDVQRVERMAARHVEPVALGAAELVGAALAAFATDAELLAGERGRIKLLLVDDAQHLDPQGARLVRVLATTGRSAAWASAIPELAAGRPAGLKADWAAG